MQEIRVLRNLGTDLPQLAEGQVAEVADDISDKLVRLGLAELIRAVPPAPTILGVVEDPGEATGKPDKARKPSRPRVKESDE